MTHRRKLTVLAASTLLALAACGGDDSGDGPATTGGATPTTAGPDTTGGATSPTTTSPGPGPDCTETVPGSELNFGVYAPAASLDPLQNAGALVAGTDMLALYDVLMRWNPDTNAWEPHLAESLTSNEDFTEWTLKLRPGVTYSNGDPMLAQHVLDNFTRLMGQGRNGSRALISRVDLDNSVAADDTTVVFRLFKPWSTFAYLLGDAPGMVVNPAVGVPDEAGVSPIDADPAGAGAGPYTVERFAPGESPYLVLTARQDYWGGAPCIETINLINIPTDQPKLESLELGELDVAFLRTPNVIADARASGEYAEQMRLQSAGVELLINQGSGNFAPITQDVRFRQAVAAAIDPEALSQRAYGGELLVHDGLLHPDSYWYTADSPAPARDPELATRLVAELKADGWDGTIRLICPDTVPDAPVAYEAALEAAGMDVDSQVTDTNTQIAAVAVQKDYDLACFGLNLSDSAMWRQLALNFTSDSAVNQIGYRNPAMDAAIDDLFAAPDDDARRAVLRTIAEIYATDIPVAVVGAVEEGLMISPAVTGIEGTQQTMFMLQDASIVR